MTMIVQYSFSLYWAVALLMTGTLPSAQPESFDEAIATAFMILVGVVLNACLITVLGLLLIDSESLANQRAKKIDNCDRFLDTHQLPHTLKQKVKEFQLYQWSRTHGLDSRSFVEAMPADLADSIRSHIYSDLIDNVPIIKQAHRLGF